MIPRHQWQFSVMNQEIDPFWSANQQVDERVDCDGFQLIKKTRNNRLLAFLVCKNQFRNDSDFSVFSFGCANQDRFFMSEMRNRRNKTPTTITKSDLGVLERTKGFLMSQTTKSGIQCTRIQKGNFSARILKFRKVIQDPSQITRTDFLMVLTYKEGSSHLESAKKSKQS